MESTNTTRPQLPAVDGWFTWPPSEAPHLIGSRCASCGDYFFPKVRVCANPRCMSSDVEEVELSRQGTLYAYTINHYPAPPPFVPEDPFRPYATAVMALEKEKMLVQGLIVSDCDPGSLRVGMALEVVLERLSTDPDGNEVVVWKFRPRVTTAPDGRA